MRGLRRLARVLQLHSSRAEAEWGLTGPQLWTLWELAHGPLALKELAELLYLHPSTLVGVVDRLEAKDLVERRTDPRDRRRLQLVLTTAGAKMVRKVEHPAGKRFQKGLRDFRKEEMTELGLSLHRLAESLEAELSGG
jgi:DNA-binding MarR family transcriptional regulator